MAYPPYLSALDARCYEPERAPEFILFKVETIDGRWDSLDGAVQLREILWNYQPVLIERHVLLLRRKQPRLASLRNPSFSNRARVAFDTPLPLPPDGADWCELEVHRTLLGRLVNFFYHEPALLMETTAGDGSTDLSLLPPVMAQGGFLLRQAPRNADDLAKTFAGQPVSNPVRSIRLGGNDLFRASVGETVTYRFITWTRRARLRTDRRFGRFAGADHDFAHHVGLFDAELLQAHQFQQREEGHDHFHA